jgi:hypothetical protein
MSCGLWTMDRYMSHRLHLNQMAFPSHHCLCSALPSTRCHARNAAQCLASHPPARRDSSLDSRRSAQDRSLVPARYREHPGSPALDRLCQLGLSASHYIPPRRHRKDQESLSDGRLGLLLLALKSDQTILESRS